MIFIFCVSINQLFIESFDLMPEDVLKSVGQFINLHFESAAAAAFAALATKINQKPAKTFVDLQKLKC